MYLDNSMTSHKKLRKYFLIVNVKFQQIQTNIMNKNYVTNELSLIDGQNVHVMIRGQYNKRND